MKCKQELITIIKEKGLDPKKFDFLLKEIDYPASFHHDCPELRKERINNMKKVCVFCNKNLPCPPCHLKRLSLEITREKLYGWKQISKIEYENYKKSLTSHE